jgi:hypothetical protein
MDEAIVPLLLTTRDSADNYAELKCLLQTGPKNFLGHEQHAE